MIKNENIKYLFAYTVSFTFILFVWCIPFIIGSNLPLMGDSFTQHYPALVYTGEYIRELVRSMWEGALALPLYDFSIGMGDDIMATLMVHSANVDIGNLLFAILPASHSITAYCILIILRLYAAGLAFSYFGVSVLKTNKWYILIGTLIYVFCNWTFIYAFLHVSFLVSLIYLPLIIAGFDAVLKNKKPYLFIISVFLMALASFYFLYMQTVFLLFYAFIRIHMLYKENYFKNLITYGLKSVSFYIVGIMMAAVTFIPIVTAHLSSRREPHINVESLLHFSFQEYLNIFTALNSIEIFGRPLTQPTGMSAIASAAIVLLLANKQIKYRKHLIASVALVLIFILIPFGSFLLNGFGYYSNRCGFLFSFTLAAITVHVLPYVINSTSKRNAVFLVGYACILLTATLINPDKTNDMIIGFKFMLAIIIVLLLPVGSLTMRLFKTKKVKVICITGLLIINTAFNAYSCKIFPFISRDLTAGYLYDVLTVSEYIEDDSFYREHLRYSPSLYYMANLSMLNHYNGTTGYWSLMNSAYQDFSVKLENSQQRIMKWCVMGFDDRAALDALSAVKYYITYDENPPFGYNMVGNLSYPELKTTWFFYENAYALPLGYTYTKVISADDYNKLDALDKQTVLMQAAVLPVEYINPGYTDIHSMLNKVRIPYTVTELKDVAWVDGVLCLLKTDASNTSAITVAFEGLPNSETYIRIMGIKPARKNYSGIVDISNGTINKSISVNPFNADHIIKRDGHLANLGYSECAKDYADIKFYLMEDYSIRDIEVYCMPMDDYPVWVEALREDVLENIVIDTNKVTGHIMLEQDKVLVLSIPYSKGWSCKVNGEAHMLLKANQMFMGLPLEAGYHSIELTYRTPGLLAGVIVSVIGAMVFGLICLGYRRTPRADTVYP